MARVHPTALVDAGAELADDVVIGAYSLVGAEVRIGAGTHVGSHCVIEGRTTIGRDNRIFSHNAIGAAPQDMKYRDEPTALEIGDRNTIREFCTFNRGTVQDGGVTRLGSDNWIMAYVHLAHDVQVGNRTILANNATLAGHVHVGDWAIVGGLSGVHQFCKIGAHAMVGFQSHVSQDVPPYMTVSGHPLAVHGVNLEGLRRRGFGRERLAAIKQMHRILYRDGLTLEAAKAALAGQTPDTADIPAEERDGLRADRAVLLDFLDRSTRGIVR